VLNSSSSRLASFALTLGIGVTGVLAPVAAPVAQARSSEPVQLKLRQVNGRVDVVIAGLGPDGRVISQRHAGSGWVARLNSASLSDVQLGAKELRMPSQGLVSIRLEHSDEGLALRVEAQPEMSLPVPTISSNGADLIISFVGLPSQAARQTGQLDLRRPNRVAQPTAIPPMRARASAPPVGDMAVGTMVLQNRSFVNVSGPPVTLTLNNAPAKDALMALARFGGYGFVFIGEDSAVSGSVNPSTVGTVSMAFQNESYARALNGVLLASGLQGKLDGRTLLVGKAAATKTFGPQMSKVIRLNQVSAQSAAQYLGNLGATFNLTNTITTTSGEVASAGTAQLSDVTSQKSSTTLSSESFGASSGPLRGLVVTTDSRLQTVTLVGDSQLVAVAEGYLKQIDLRQRQVALNVRILDVVLDNDSQINNSFAFRSGNSFIVSDQGRLVANFGAYKPPGSEVGGLPGRFNSLTGTTPLTGTGSLASEGESFVDTPNSPYPFPGGGSTIDGVLNPGTYRPGFGTYSNPLQPGVTSVDVDDETGSVTYNRASPTRFQYPANQFFDFLTAQIQSSSTKTLASPTLIIQEGSESAQGSDASKISADGKVGRERSNEALVSVGTQLVTSFEVKQDENGNNFCQPIFSNAGLTFGARVDKIDDNGFVTFSLSPEISAAVGVTQSVGNCGNVSTINSRTLDTGKIRVRDGQTLILTGVISDSDVKAVTKWPVLGDIPFIGQFFRSSGGDRSKNELVILVTPNIIDEAQGGGFGYGYRPSLPAARQIMSGL